MLHHAAEPWIAWFDQATAAFAAGRYAEAAALFQAAATACPGHPTISFNLALALRGAGRSAEALSLFRSLDAARPDHPPTLFQLATMLADLGRPAEAVPVLERLVSVRPDHPQAAFTLGNLLMAQNRPCRAERAFSIAVALDPASAAGVNNLGAAIMAQRRPHAATAYYRRAARLAPDCPEYHKNLGASLLMTGRFEEGFREYEWRRRQAVWRWNRPFPGAPAWQGGALAGRTILVQFEQGLGDTFQFARYFALLRAMGARTLFECQPILTRVLASVPGIDRLVAPGEPLSDVDCQASLMSLPLLCRTTVGTIPGGVPYLRAEPALAAAWRQRLDAGQFNVGIHWHANGPERSIPLRRFAGLAAVPGVQLHSLQQGQGLEQRAALRSEVPFASEVEAGRLAPADAFVDEAALIAGLDLVVCCDSAVAHLAGAMGVPVFLVLPWLADWRWMLDPVATPWYPRTTLFRMGRPDDWEGVMQRIVAAVAPAARSKARSGGPAA
ncbi:MAG TPA: tetratricopeptide repeat protein [Azospirillaceae bacterium]|nr:tetratricopeptide repeat protein [Azospirillaceae bacterium]